MPFVPNTIFPKRGIAFGALLLATPIALTAFGFVNGRTNQSAEEKDDSAQPAVSMMLQRSSDQKRLEAETIILRSTGFSPREITRPQGKFLLAVDNRSGLDQVTLVLKREAGARLRDKPMSKDKSRWREVQDLHPGNHVLTERAHLEWVCRIMITAR